MGLRENEIRENGETSVDNFSKMFFCKVRENDQSGGGESRVKPEFLRWGKL